MAQVVNELPESAEQLSLQVTEERILTDEQIGKLKSFRNVQVIDDVSNADASAKLAYVKKFAKILDALRRIKNEPFEKKVKENNNRFKVVSLEVDATIAYLNKQMIDYFRQQEEKRRKEQERLNRQAEKNYQHQIDSGNVPEVPEAVAKVAETPAKQVKTEKSTTSIRTTMRWRPARPGVSDKKKTSKVPDSYWMLDTEKIDQLVKGLKTQDQADEIFHGDIIIYPDYGTASRLR